MWSDGQGAPAPTDVRFADFVTDQVLADLCAGEIVVCRDVASDPRATAGAHSDIGVRSWVTVPFRRGGDLTFAFSVADRQPRDWRDDQIELLRDVAVRVLPRLERARAEEALVWEAARLRAIVEAAPVGLGVVAADGEVIMRNDVLRSIWAGRGAGALRRRVQGLQGVLAGDRRTARAGGLAGGAGTAARRVVRRRGRGHRQVRRQPRDDRALHGAHPARRRAPGRRDDRPGHHAPAGRRESSAASSPKRSAPFTKRSCSTRRPPAPSWPASPSHRGGCSPAATEAASSSSARMDRCGASPASACPATREIDDIVAQAIGDQSATVQPLPPGGAEDAESLGSVVLAVPLMIRGEVFGAMAFTYRNRRSLDDDQVRIARAFADQAALAIENARLRARIEETAIEAERTRLARDLHDSVTQSLFAASLKAEALAGLLDDQEQALGALEELRRLTRGSLAGMRTMLLEMRGDALEQTPLPELLRHLVEASGGRIGADVRLERPRAPPAAAPRRADRAVSHRPGGAQQRGAPRQGLRSLGRPRAGRRRRPAGDRRRRPRLRSRHRVGGPFRPAEHARTGGSHRRGVQDLRRRR